MLGQTVQQVEQLERVAECGQSNGGDGETGHGSTRQLNYLLAGVGGVGKY